MFFYFLSGIAASILAMFLVVLVVAWFEDRCKKQVERQQKQQSHEEKIAELRRQRDAEIEKSRIAAQNRLNKQWREGKKIIRDSEQLAELRKVLHDTVLRQFEREAMEIDRQFQAACEEATGVMMLPCFNAEDREEAYRSFNV